MSKKQAEQAPEAAATEIEGGIQGSIAPSFLDRMRTEGAELSARLGKLNGFVCSIDFSGVDQEERERLLGQRTAMTHYLELLNARIAYHERRLQE